MMETRTAMRATPIETTAAAVFCQMATPTSAKISTPTATAAATSDRLSGALTGLSATGWGCSPSILACRRATSAAMVERACIAVCVSLGLSGMAIASIALPGLSGGLGGCLVGNVSGMTSGSPWPVDSSLSSPDRVSPGLACSRARRAERVRTSASDRVRVWPGAG